LACGVAWRRLSVEGFDRLAGKGISYGAARNEAPNTHGLDVHIVGAANSAGQAAMSLSTHARSVTILCRGDTLAKSMSSYLIDQLATRANIRTMVRTEVVAAHGDVSLEAIDVRNSAAGETTRLESDGLYIFIGAAAETDGFRPGSRSTSGATCWRAPKCAQRSGGRSTATPTSSRRACLASLPAGTCGSAR
jgi:thioredoxin reductase (NADPH)